MGDSRVHTVFLTGGVHQILNYRWSVNFIARCFHAYLHHPSLLLSHWRTYSLFLDELCYISGVPLQATRRVSLLLDVVFRLSQQRCACGSCVNAQFCPGSWPIFVTELRHQPRVRFCPTPWMTWGYDNICMITGLSFKMTWQGKLLITYLTYFNSLLFLIFSDSEDSNNLWKALLVAWNVDVNLCKWWSIYVFMHSDTGCTAEVSWNHLPLNSSF